MRFLSALTPCGLLAGWLVLTPAVWAQDQQPVDAPTTAAAPDPSEQPALSPADRGDLREDPGTTIVGERESPIGLYITPWRDAYSEQDIDRPARLLQVDMSPIDREVFARQVEYHNALAKSGRYQPGSSATPALPENP